MGDNNSNSNNNGASSQFASITVSPPLKTHSFHPKNPSIDSTDSSSSVVSTSSKNSGTSADQAYHSDASNRSKSSSASSTSTHVIANTRSQRSRSIQNNDPAIPGRGRQYINIPNTSAHQHGGRSPLRSSQDNSAKLNATRAGAAAVGSNTQSSIYSQNQRRGSVASANESFDFSTSLGMPYTLAGSSNSVSTINNGGTRSSIGQSSASSPRNSFSSTFQHGAQSSDSSGGSLGQRRYSDHSFRRPSTEEVFDQMEREQDGIVLKLSREIQHLKEENRSLRQTIHQLSSTSGRSTSRSQSRSQSRSSVDSRRRRNSTVFPDEDSISVTSSSISTTPRSSNFSSLPQSNTSSRKPSINFAAISSTNSYDASKYPPLAGPNFDSYRSNASTINAGEEHQETREER